MLPPELVEIRDANLRDLFRRTSQILAGCSPESMRFPGPNPVSLDRSKFGDVKTSAYVTCEKTDGTRFCLVLCTVADDAPPGPDGRPIGKVAVLINRAFEAWFVPLRRVPDAAWQGTLLDGEVAFDKLEKKWTFLAFDAYAVSGLSVRFVSIHDRLAACSALRFDNDKEVIDIRTKTMYAQFAEFEAALPSIRRRFEVDGLVLTPVADSVCIGRHTRMFKLKFDARHTVDFVFVENKKLAIFDGSDTHTVVGSIIGDVPLLENGQIVECAYHGPGTWTFVGLRTDKTQANDRLTYDKTLLNVRENLGIEDVRGLLT